MTWRRLSPARALNLPIDLLEGATGADARNRRFALGGSMYGVASLLTLVFANFEMALFIGAVMLVLLFIPPAEIMSILAQREAPRTGVAKVGPNDRCPCGSGAKFKKCCGR